MQFNRSCSSEFQFHLHGKQYAGCYRHPRPRRASQRVEMWCR
jgi:hypothetical protein